MPEIKTKDYYAPYYGLSHGSSTAAKDYDEQIQEFRAGPKGWYELSMTGRLPRPDEHGLYDELSYERSGMPPEFWHGILLAAAGSAVLWVGAFFVLRALLS